LNKSSGDPLFHADRPLPLAIGVHKPLGELLGGKRAKRLLEWWTKSPAYVAAVAAGGCRYSLDGSEAGQVTEEHRAIAIGMRDARALRQSGTGTGAAGTQAAPVPTAEQAPAPADRLS
jgi:sRNA-binding protein